MKHPHFQTYQAKDGWRWRLRAGNGLIVAESGEAYASHRNCLRAIDSVRTAIHSADVQHAGRTRH